MGTVANRHIFFSLRISGANHEQLAYTSIIYITCKAAVFFNITKSCFVHVLLNNIIRIESRIHPEILSVFQAGDALHWVSLNTVQKVPSVLKESPLFKRERLPLQQNAVSCHLHAIHLLNNAFLSCSMD